MKTFLSKISILIGLWTLLELGLYPSAMPTLNSPNNVIDCDKCREFDVMDEQHSLCSFGCSYTVKTNIPENADNAALEALANRILPLLRLMRNFDASRTHGSSQSKSGLQYNPISGQFEVILPSQSIPSMTISQPSSPQQSSSSSVQRRQRQRQRKLEPQTQPQRMNDNTHFHITSIDQYQEEPDNDDKNGDGSNGMTFHENPILSDKNVPHHHVSLEMEIHRAQKNDYENPKQNSQTVLPVGNDAGSPNNDFDWTEELNSFIGTDENKPNVNSMSTFVDDSLNEIPHEEIDPETKKTIVRPSSTKGKESNLLEMFYNEDSSLLESKRFKKD